MEIRVVLKSGIMIHSFNCPKEYQATIRRYENDQTAKVIKL